MTPEQLAEAILRAAGSSMRHFMPRTKEEVLKAAAEALEQIRAEVRHD